jgi:drug/metabolite transporter (DMT)-like permease
VKPELTFRRSLRLISKRWWLLLLGGVLFAGLAFVVANGKKPHYTASDVLGINDVNAVPRIDGPGYALASNNPKYYGDWSPDDFVSPPAGAAASKALGGSPTGDQIVANLTMTPLSTNSVRLNYVGGSNPDETVAVLKAYTTALLNQRIKREQTAILAVINQLRTVTPQTTGLIANEGTLAKGLGTVQGNFTSSFDGGGTVASQKVAAGGPPTILAVIGGFLAGVAFFALVALIIGRLDNRVRRPEDIEVVGVPVVDIHSEVDKASVQLLRSELELSGVGSRLGVIAVTRATRGEGASGLALALARTFAGVGTATILVSADLRGRTVREQEGVSALLDGTATSMPLIALEENLMWLPEGTTNAPPETLFSAPRVERIVRDLRDVAGVVVIDAPAVLEDSEALPLIACSDIVLLTVRPGGTRWSPLGSAISLIQRVAKRPLHICYDRAPTSSSVPAAGELKPEPAERVHQVIEVPAS